MNPFGADASGPSRQESAKTFASSVTSVSSLETVFEGIETKEEMYSTIKSTYFGRIPIHSPHIPLEQTQKDFRREKVLLNMIPFIPHETHVFRNDAFISTLSRLASLLLRELKDDELN